MYSSPIEYTNLPFSSAVAGISLFASLLFLVGEPQIWPGDLLVVVAGGVFFWLFLDLPRYYGTKEFHFSICLLAYPNVRTEPSEIGRNRGKKLNILRKCCLEIQYLVREGLHRQLLLLKVCQRTRSSGWTPLHWNALSLIALRIWTKTPDLSSKGGVKILPGTALRDQ